MPHVSMVLTPGFQFLALGVQAAFELANVLRDETYYTLSITSVEGGPVMSSSGFSVPTTRLDDVGQVDTLLLLAGLVPPPQQDEATLATLRDLAKGSRRVAGLCTGSFLLGQMGFLDGRRATTTGPMPRRCAGPFQMCGLRTTASSSTRDRSGHRPA